MTCSRFVGIVSLLMVFSVSAVYAAERITVDESKMRIDLASKATLKLPVSNKAAQAISSTIRLEFLDTNDRSLLKLSSQIQIPPGTANIEIPLPGFLDLDDVNEANYGWLRIRYTVPGETSGTVSVSRLAPEPFALTVLHPYVAFQSARFDIQVMAINPSTGKPAPNVQVFGKLASEENPDQPVVRSARTDSSGYAYLNFDRPVDPSERSLDLEVTGKVGGFARRVTDSIRIFKALDASVTTDKPIYQPGQKLRVRILAIDRLRNVARDVPLTLAIEGPDGDDVFETTLVTSSFGEAHAEWAIPENARAGQYRIEAGFGGDSRSGAAVWVGPYDLPNFTLDVQHDRSYYLPGQHASIDVRGMYLFGKPVPSARVRIAQETFRSWNYRELKWDVEEGAVIEGTTDSEGRYHAVLNLEEEMEDLLVDDRRGRSGAAFSDLEWAVTLTDPSTGRAEQRRFSIRITRYPIHLYLRSDRQAPNLPLEFYVTASYADGSPAVCDIEILEAIDDNHRFLGTTRTNQYGIAKFTGTRMDRDSFPNDDWTGLEIRARDAKGNVGLQSTTLHMNDDFIRIHTDKIFYRTREPIDVRIESTTKTGSIVINAVRDGAIVHSAVVPILDGDASARIPYSRALKGEIHVFAYDPANPRWRQGDRLILFPDAPELQIEALPEKGAYAPGDEATLNIRVRNADGSTQAGLLGITVIDKAVEERAADSRFGRLISCCFRTFDSYPSLPGFTQSDLGRVDRSKPIPADFELAAEALLAQSGGFFMDIVDTAHESAQYAFNSGLQNRLERLKNSGGVYPSGPALPFDEASMRTMVLKLDPDFGTLRDPWDMPYRLKSFVRGSRNTIEVMSAGPDKQFDTADDFNVASLTWDNFASYATAISAALARHHERTGRYIRDLQTLRDELRLTGADFDAWRDPKGEAYSAEVRIDGKQFTVTVRAADNLVWTGGIDYTVELDARVARALNSLVEQKKPLPETETDLKTALIGAGIADKDLRDPWDHPYYAAIGKESGYIDRVTIVSALTERLNIVPVSQLLLAVRLRSAGPDGTPGTPDDFTAITIIRPLSEQTAQDPEPRNVELPAVSGGTGGIVGFLIDATGAFLPGVAIKVTSTADVTRSMLTNDTGEFSFAGLTPGVYRVRAEFTGFKSKTLNVTVMGGAFTRIVSVLEVGDITSVMMVAASRESFATSAPPTPEKLATPRLREYFPETLLWQPALETGRNGEAQVRFKLADNITTWKVAVIASTKDGRVRSRDTEIVAFQPFFLEHDPPKFLTEGDRIALPVVVRNYVDQNQTVELSMKPEAWFVSLDSPEKGLEVAANAAQQAVFAFEARTPVKNAPQRITARGNASSDAIEKTSTVYPMGREMTSVASEILRTSSMLNVTVPTNALSGTVHAELKIYPNLMSHVDDAIEAIMRRPNGCAEQVISSAYPSLLFLRRHKQTGARPDPLADKALAYLRVAAQLIRGYRTEDGGVSYWTRGQANAAVTAYALQFLSEAKEFVPIDSDLLDQASEWLTKHQMADGSWGGDIATTAYIAQVLSSPGISRKGNDPVHLAIAYVQARGFQPAAPYVTASLALTALNIGDKKLADMAIETLKSQAKPERDTVYWDLQTNTPFYGWGLPGRLETTATVVRALAAAGANDALVDKGLLFLLKNKDDLGIWHSTQATVRVLETFIRLAGGSQARNAGAADVLVNGVRVNTVRFGGASKTNGPVLLDISRFLVQGANRVEITADKKMPFAIVHLVENHYVPWDATASDLVSGPLRFSAKFDKVETTIGEAVRVQAQAERIGFRGYGMMLAEIGLPPGAEVDRASLELAAEKSGGALSRYDILPDRVIFYLWPTGGGTTFEFQFRPRYGVDAHTPASKLYDYYNPDAHVILPPTRFIAR